MEVMLEIYRTLKALGMEWKEKRTLGGLGGLKARRGGAGVGIERAREFDGGGGVDLKAAAGVYFVETRARVQDVVVRVFFVFRLSPIRFNIDTKLIWFSLHSQVLMNLQLYMVDPINYLVDFHHKKSYRASTEPGAGKFDMAIFDPTFSTESSSESSRSLKENAAGKEDDVVSPFVFMDVACRLILELAGGGQ